MPLNFSPDTLEGAANAIKKLDRFRELVLAARDADGDAEGGLDEKLTKAVSSALEQFSDGMNDDLNTPRAVAALFGLMKAVQPMINKVWFRHLADRLETWK